MDVIRIDWQAVPGADAYKVYRCNPADTNDCNVVSDQLASSPLDFADTVVPGATWSYKVQAYAGPSAAPTAETPLAGIYARHFSEKEWPARPSGTWKLR